VLNAFSLGRPGIDLFIEKNLFLEAQFPAWGSISPILLAPAGQAPGLGTSLTKAAIRAGMFLLFLLPATSRLKHALHAAKALEA
jgi:hypothetical protein